jgi:dTDP-4-amino-4,6-dideoxygalactose transaminase
MKPHPGSKDCENSRWFMDHVMYLPFHASVGDKDFSDLLEKITLAF